MPLNLGSLTRDPKKRPFVSDLNAAYEGLFPFPIALINRERATALTLSGLAQRLLYALFYLGWNELESAAEAPPMGYGCKVLRDLIGRSKQRSNSDLHRAFEELRVTPCRIPLRADPDQTKTTTFLQWHRYHPGTNAYFWKFANDIVDWCRAGDATYAWMDVRVAPKLKSPDTMRMYELACALAGRTVKSIKVRTPELRAFLDAEKRYPDDCDFEGKLVARSLRHIGAVAPFTIRMEPVRFASIGIKVMLELTVQAKGGAPSGGAPKYKPLSREDVTWCYEVFPALP